MCVPLLEMTVHCASLAACLYSVGGVAPHLSKLGIVFNETIAADISSVLQLGTECTATSLLAQAAGVVAISFGNRLVPPLISVATDTHSALNWPLLTLSTVG